MFAVRLITKHGILSCPDALLAFRPCIIFIISFSVTGFRKIVLGLLFFKKSLTKLGLSLQQFKLTLFLPISQKMVIKTIRNIFRSFESSALSTYCGRESIGFVFV